jgi:hypothetical protein
MNEHQRRVWERMVESIDSYRAGRVNLGKLVSDLRGLMGAADLHDESLIDAFWNHEAPIDMELELRTEPWAPADSASDAGLDRAIEGFRAWALDTLASTDDQRT